MFWIPTTVRRMISWLVRKSSYSWSCIPMGNGHCKMRQFYSSIKNSFYNWVLLHSPQVVSQQRYPLLLYFTQLGSLPTDRYISSLLWYKGLLLLLLSAREKALTKMLQSSLTLAKSYYFCCTCLRDFHSRDGPCFLAHFKREFPCREVHCLSASFCTDSFPAQIQLNSGERRSSPKILFGIDCFLFSGVS